MLFIILNLFWRKHPPRGAISGMFLLFYGLFRFLVEFVRQPDSQLGLYFNEISMGPDPLTPMIKWRGASWSGPPTNSPVVCSAMHPGGEVMRAYLDLMQKILDEGTVKSDRTGTGTVSPVRSSDALQPGRGIPAGDHQEVPPSAPSFTSCSGSQRRYQHRHLKEHGVGIWDEWADEHGDLGPAYGAQWRSLAGGRRVCHRPGSEGGGRHPAQPGIPRRIIVPPGTWASWTKWRWHPATPSSSSMYGWAFSCRSTSVVVMFSLACCSTLPVAPLTHMMAQCDLEVGDFV